MSITSLTELSTAISNWIARTDLATPIADFITLFETEANRKLRVRQQMATQVTTPSTAGWFTLPTDFLEAVNIIYTGSPQVNLTYIDPSQIHEMYPVAQANVPRHYTIQSSTDGTGVNIMPTSTTAVNFTYYQKITSLSSTNTSNWLLAAHPDVYLAGALTEANVYVKDYDTAAVWKGRRDTLFDEIIALDQKTRGPSYIVVPGLNP